MFFGRIRLLSAFGIPIYIDLSWLLIAALLTISLKATFQTQLELAQVVVPAERVPSQALLMALATTVAFFACVVLHELGHALVGRSRGMEIRGITLFLFGGVAELGSEPPSAGSEFLMAIGGPVVSLVLGIGFLVATWIGQTLGWPLQLLLVTDLLGTVNLGLLLFNLVPAFPLDGGRVLRSFLWWATGNLRRATHWSSTLGRAFGWLLIAVGVFSLISPLFEAERAVNWGGLWFVLIGYFVLQAARGSYQQVLLREALRGEPVRRFMRVEPITVPPTLDLERWVDEYVYRYHRRSFPVAENGRVEGMISTEDLQDVPRDEWDRHTVAEVMETELDGLRISPATDAMEALERMQRTGSSRLLVLEGEQLVGIVTLKDLLRFLNLKLELEDQSENHSPEAAPAHDTEKKGAP